MHLDSCKFCFKWVLGQQCFPAAHVSTPPRHLSSKSISTSTPLPQRAPPSPWQHHPKKKAPGPISPRCLYPDTQHLRHWQRNTRHSKRSDRQRQPAQCFLSLPPATHAQWRGSQNHPADETVVGSATLSLEEEEEKCVSPPGFIYKNRRKRRTSSSSSLSLSPVQKMPQTRSSKFRTAGIEFESRK